MKGKISGLIIFLLSLSLYGVTTSGAVYMGEVGVKNSISVTDSELAVPVFFTFTQPPAARPLSLYLIKKDENGLWWYTDKDMVWKKADGNDTKMLKPAFQTTDAHEIDALKFLNYSLPLSFFTGGTNWQNLTVFICVDEENTTLGIADLGTGNPMCDSLDFINKTGKTTTYTVTPSAGVNGSISPSSAQIISSGLPATFTVTPTTGYTASVSGTCGGTLSGNTYTTVPITANCTVSATFTANTTTYTVTPSAGVNGSISPSSAQTINSVLPATFTVTPNAGYTASVSGTCGGTLSGNTYTTVPITADCTVTATFKAKTGPTLPDWGHCTSTSVAYLQVDMQAAQGELPSKDVTVNDNCGNSLSYTGAAVTQGNDWLAVVRSSDTTGVLTVKVVKSTLTAGKYVGKVKLTPAGYPEVTATVNLQVAGQCVATSATLSPASITQSIQPGNNAAAVSITVKDNCSKDISYTVKSVTGTPASATAELPSWIASPLVGNTGTGTLAVSFNTSALAVNTYSGSIELTTPYGDKSIPISITVTDTTSTPPPTNTDATRIYNYDIIYRGYAVGQTRYFFFNENSDLGLGNKNSLYISQMDMTAESYNEIDMVVKYVGPTCGNFDPASMLTDYMSLKNKSMTHEEWKSLGYYGANSSDAFQHVEFRPPNSEGCYYVMVHNPSMYAEPKISLKYADDDSAWGHH